MEKGKLFLGSSSWKRKPKGNVKKGVADVHFHRDGSGCVNLYSERCFFFSARLCFICVSSHWYICGEDGGILFRGEK
jgi:hypothetical protein